MKKLYVWACVGLVSAELCFAAQITFTGEINSDWFNRTNWSLRIIPGPSDDVLIKSGVFVPQNASFSTMTIEGGAVGGVFTISNRLDLVDGIINGDVTIAKGATFEIRDPGRKHLHGDLINHGTVRWSGDNEINAGETSRFQNKPGGLFLIENNQSYRQWAPELPVIINEGTIRKNVGTGTTLITGVNFTNSALVEVQTGRITLEAGVESSGEFRVRAGAALNLHSGTINLQPWATFTGDGFYGVTGSATVNGDIWGNNFQVTGELKGTNSVFGKLNWNAGTLSSFTTIKPSGSLDINGHSIKHTSSASITNEGYIHWRDQSELRWTDTQLINRPSGTIQISNDERLGLWSGTTASILNEGSIFKTLSTGVTTMATTDFINRGEIFIGSGRFLAPSNFRTRGEIEVFTGASFELVSGTTVLEPGNVFLGQGYYGVTGSVNVEGDIYGTNFQVTGTLKGVNVIKERLNWSAGSLNSQTTVEGTLDINGNAIKHMVGARLDNKGVVKWRDQSELRLTDTEIINRGFFDILNDERIALWSGTKASVLNEGSLKKHSTGVTTLAEVTFENKGTVEIPVGTLSLTRPYLQTDGETWLQGTLEAPEVLIEGGRFIGGGTIRGNLVNNAQVGIGFPQKELVVHGNYQQTGVLFLTLSSTDPATFGLEVTGSATLQGGLWVSLMNNFIPPYGSHFVGLSARSIIGDFSNYTLPPEVTSTLSGNSLTVSLPPAFEISKTPEGDFTAEVRVEPGMPYVVETSADMRQWEKLTESDAPEGVIRFTDLDSSIHSLRFYRIRPVVIPAP